MSANVPNSPPYTVIDVIGLGSGKPVTSVAWSNQADLLNWIVGTGTTLVPGCGATLSPGTNKTFQWWVYGDDWHASRAWVVVLGAAQFNYYSLTPSDECWGTITVNGNTYNYGFQGREPNTIIIVEDYAAGRDPDPSTGAAAGEEVTCQVTVNSLSGTVEVHHIGLYEVPKGVLEVPIEGVDVSTTARARPIFADSGDEVGLDQFNETMLFARRMTRRGGMWSFNATGNEVTTTSASYEDVFPVSAPCALQTRNTTEEIPAVRAVKVSVFGRAATGTVGRVRFTMTSGDSLELDIDDSDGAWAHGELDVSVDVADAEPAGIHRFGGAEGDRDECTIEMKRVSGSDPVYIETICINDPCGI